MKALYMKNSYLKEFETVVKSVKDGKFVVLEETAFYPSSGGQAHDTGTIKRISDDKSFKVVYAGKFSGDISHEVECPDGEELKEGDSVKCTIDWERRYKLMRSHTAAHVISSIIHRKTGAMITGNQLKTDKCRIDFSLEDYDPYVMEGFVKKADEEAAKGVPVEISFISREDAENEESLSLLAKGLPGSIKEIRIVDIKGIDRQADGGTHVKNTKEIGKINFIKCENKGKNNRRVYFSLGDR